MTSSIRLHPKFGLNPTIPLCYWCGKGKNEVALLGAAYKGEAPRNLVIDMEPCTDCADKWAQGIVLFEATPGSEGPEYTGRWAVIREEAVSRMFKPQETVDLVLLKRKALMDPETFQKLFVAQESPE
mgnify:CR=1 FL=1